MQVFHGNLHFSMEILFVIQQIVCFLGFSIVLKLFTFISIYRMFGLLARFLNPASRVVFLASTQETPRRRISGGDVGSQKLVGPQDAGGGGWKDRKEGRIRNYRGFGGGPPFFVFVFFLVFSMLFYIIFVVFYVVLFFLFFCEKSPGGSPKPLIIASIRFFQRGAHCFVQGHLRGKGIRGIPGSARFVAEKQDPACILNLLSAFACSGLLLALDSQGGVNGPGWAAGEFPEFFGTAWK